MISRLEFSVSCWEFPDCRQFRLLETTTLKVITDVQQYRSEFGVLYLNEQNQAGLERLLQGAQLSFEALGRFRPMSFTSDSSLDRKSSSLKDLAPYPQVRFLQEDERYSFFSEDLIDFAQSPRCMSAIEAQWSSYYSRRIFMEPARGSLLNQNAKAWLFFL